MPQWKASRFAGAGLALLASGLAFAQGGYYPHVPKVRITDVRSVSGDLEGDRFQFMFEIINWTGSPANGLSFVANIGSTLVPTDDGFDTKVRITGAEVRAAGRPMQPADVNGDGVINTADLEDANRTGVLDPGEDKDGNGRLDNDPLPGNPVQNNDWHPGAVTPTSAAWDAGTALPFRDLGALPNAGTRCTLIPGCALSGRLVTLPDPETADNGGNALDGFVVEVDGWEPGETISFNLVPATGTCSMAAWPFPGLTQPE